MPRQGSVCFPLTVTAYNLKSTDRTSFPRPQKGAKCVQNRPPISICWRIAHMRRTSQICRSTTAHNADKVHRAPKLPISHTRLLSPDPNKKTGESRTRQDSSFEADRMGLSAMESISRKGPSAEFSGALVLICADRLLGMNDYTVLVGTLYEGRTNIRLCGTEWLWIVACSMCTCADVGRGDTSRFFWRRSSQGPVRSSLV
ncbi:hypothetical protein B0H34DRAFT_3328 [Crassisporium funariophilum]|nr:hypothetical protein B0H34DRAFT_3328 [Crassisporium funariophilum]